MGRNKAVGPDQIPTEAWKSLGGEGISWLTSLFNKIFTSAKMREEWRLSDVIPIFKNKGDAQGKPYGEVRERQRDLHLAFIDLQNAYDSVPRELIWKTLIDKGASSRYIKVIRDMYEGAKTRVRTPIGTTKFFPVEVGLHQGSTISPYLFALILDKLSRGIHEDIPWCLIFADDIVLVSESAEDVTSVTLRLPTTRISVLKTILQPKEFFRYLGSMMHKSGRIDEDVAHRIKAAWLKWRAVTRDLCDRNVPLKLKGKFYRVAIRPAMLYGSECWPITKALANSMELSELRMISGVYHQQDEGRTIEMVWACQEKTSAPVRRVEALVVGGLRRRGRPKLRWKDKVKLDMKELLLSEDMTSDRNE
uniref:Reverse transcriptase domain-containing protein n=1 Tax=Tanacetum cinerariifolium TaxID=118510 RepID=A0A6L2P4Y0_TANCI|nr:hypothetical protein [Tanacetum cinerariifolium]